MGVRPRRELFDAPYEFPLSIRESLWKTMRSEEASLANEEMLQRVVVESMDALELRDVLEEVARHAASEPGKRLVLAAEPVEDSEGIRRDLALVSEIREFARLEGPLGLAGLAPLDGLFARVRNPATVMDAEEILAVRDFLDLVHGLRGRLISVDPRYEGLYRLGGRLVPLDDLRVDISRVLDDHGVVKSSASPELEELRRSSRSLRGRIVKTLERIVRDRDMSRIVQDDFITMRGDRYVILLRPDFKGLLDGIVHDHSRSGASVYVEPLDVVDKNNEVASLMDRERDEIRRIFTRLTERIRSRVEEMSTNHSILAYLDAFQARALYASGVKGVVPELVEGGFKIMAARHPLLLAAGEDPVVPMDVIQETSTLATVISGANMGGKTVALKIAGLFPLMTRCAIPVPAAEGTRINPFSRIMADIGDEQDLRGQVSTFSGHMMRIRAILSLSEAGDLVLLDELGSATDPVEGAALAMAILDELIERRTRVVVTTHLTHLKAYALGRPDVKNVSVEFHPKTLRPTFRLIYDLPGESHAIATAQRIGLPDHVIRNARGYLAEGEGGATGLVARLRERIEETTRLEKELEERRRELEEELERTRAQRETVAQEFAEKARELLKKAETDIARLQKSLKRGKRSKRAPREYLRDIAGEVEAGLGTPLDSRPEVPPIGSRVRINTLGREGVVASRLERGTVEVSAGNMKIRAKVEDLTVLQGPPQKKNALKKEQIGLDMPLVNPRTELNVIGLRVDDALPLVDRAIDDAVLSGLASLSIIHGKGTGRLKQAIREHLAGHALVRRVSDGDIHQGGAGVTLVELETG